MTYDEDSLMDDLDNKWSHEKRERFVNRMKHKLLAKERRYSR